VKLESNLDNLSNRVEKLCLQIDNSLPLLEKINLRMEDDILRRTASDKLLTKLAEDFNQLSYMTREHQKKILEHDYIINDLNQISKDHKTIFKMSKMAWKVIASLSIAAFTVYGYVENKKDERHHESLIIMKEIEEKKKRLDYNREKYLIRNGMYGK
jgi:predicted transcriptional regulator YheO